MKLTISVVIPTFNRVDLLAKQLDALANQTCPNEYFEIIVVNDGSTDSTESFLANWKSKQTNHVVINQLNAGPAKARNAGVAAAKSEFIAFTDDDCIVSSNWIDEIRFAFRQYPVIALQGRTTTDRSKRTPLTHQIENLNYRLLTVTCNAAVRKSAFDAVGGFSTAFPFAHNEDTELSWKLCEQGETRFIPSMHVFHPPILKSFMSQVKRMKLLASEFTLFRLQPNAYKLNRNSSPWQTLLFEVGVYHFLRNVKFSLGFYKKPSRVIIGLSLQVVSQLYLVSLIPYFFKAAKDAKSL